ncbi:erythrocyte membrane protein 1, PfEMP1, putative [Plasmodium reichenowi]|uniref:Erythrocyte membrane protein 1, PfEMP1, putative n=1 Tax=Plasmodium reichenowi TaxID=5854 RepID=A0A2P9D9T8_PLARE|nr:erythrocyte membrane protein 1, PfEMP1, putative [Plasmodium reichenowi]
MVVQVKRGGNVEDETAKHALDKIGKEVYEEAKNATEKYKRPLQGRLSKAQFEDVPKQQQTPRNACDLKYEYHTNVTKGQNKEYPCRTGTEKRFSEVHSGECDNSKIRGSTVNEGGACAPYRRVHLCVRNLENINRYDRINNDTLLADVCLAALHEGASIYADHARYKETNNDVNTNICTMLARSFADIGDIIRGKDLYRGDKGNDKLEKNLRKIFEKIYEKLESSKERYQKDKKTGKFYQLREDWWYANRETIWKAMRCTAPSDSDYFIRDRCGGGSGTKGKCRCINFDVPTYFDYVPQFLRWFEEWAEEFCRLRKYKLENAIKICRGEGEDGEKLYCDLNGYDCKQTIKGKDKLVEGEGCKKCSLPCDNFVHWIDNQRKEFEKQREKYNKEIKEKHDTKDESNGNINNIYVKEFYTKLEKYYKEVKSFLEKLSKGKICGKQPEVKNKTFIDFNEATDDIFSHTEICQACPWCGTHKKGEKWEATPDAECATVNTYNIKKGVTTDIHILSTDRGKTKILEKLQGFCKNDGIIKKDDWKCYYEHKEKADGTPDSNICVLQNEDTGKRGEKSMPYNPFFWKWVTEMLIDSMYWKNQLNNCIDRAKKGICKNKQCEENCKCYERWIEQKKKEWVEMITHFKKQKDIPEDNYITTLQILLNVDDIVTNIREGYEDAKGMERIQKILEQEKRREEEEKAAAPGGSVTEGKTTIDYLIAHEENDANTCQKGEKCQKASRSNHETVARSETAHHPAQRGPTGADAEDEDHHDDHDPEKERKLKIEVDEIDAKELDDEDKPKVKDTRPNPCYGNNNIEYPVVVQKVAEDMSQKAQEEANKRSGAISNLKGHISKAKIKNATTKNYLNDNDICNIDKTHSNADGSSNNPCHGKGDGFNIGDTWEDTNSQSMTQSVHIRPRRQHMCTSNLEKIDDNFVTNSGSVNDTFLVDVLWAAKKEADWIKKEYEGQNKEKIGQNGLEGDQVTTCRAMKSSFADIGDIIKGTDLWDKGQSSKDIKNKLEKIFLKIKDELKSKLSDIDKYMDDDKDPKIPYKQLRADWWEANRDQVWKAMQCAIKDDNFPCKSDHTPYDDYIPQRLRWMTEWAEWYCKAQSQAYDELETQCMTCKNKKTQCTQGTTECDKCKPACENYKKLISTWQRQWNNMQMKYYGLYSQANTASRGIAVLQDVPDYQQMLDFFKELQEKYKETAKSHGVTTDPMNTPYATAPGYIHQEAHITECQEQTKFCNGGNNYAFKDPPHGYATACKCTERQEPKFSTRSEDTEQVPPPPPPPPPQPKAEDNVNPCEIVNNLFTNSDKKYLEEACSQKYGGNNARLGWKCIPSTKGDVAATSQEGERGTTGSETGDKVRRMAKRSTESSGSPTPGGKDSGSICVPPRRRKMYIGKLTQWAKEQMGNTGEGKVVGSGEGEGANGANAVTPQGLSTSPTTPQSQSDLLRRAFVESAAIETFFLWHQYKQLHKPRGDGVEGPLGGVGGGDAGTSIFSSGGTEMRASRMPGLGAGVGGLGIPGVGGLGVGGFRVPGGPEPIPLEVPGGNLNGISTSQLHDDALGSKNAPGTLDSGEDQNNPQQQLLSGTIPPAFLRQMFYTIADYRDILFSGSSDDNTKSSTYNDILNADKEMKGREENIKNAIQTFFKNGGRNQATSGSEHSTGGSPPSPRVTAHPHSGTQTQHSDTSPEQWWDTNAPSIWEAMICALTYTDNTDERKGVEKKPQKVEAVYKQFFGENNDNPGQPGGKPNGKQPGTATKDGKYHYETVTLEDESSDIQAFATTASASGDSTTLDSFVKRPTYFRYLEEWGETFCYERTKRLKQVKKACRVNASGRDTFCSGDGHDCTREVKKRNDILSNLDCPECYKHCRKYRKWIDQKFEEFDKQKNKYVSEHDKLNCNSSGGGGDNKEFCKEIKEKNTAAQFLQSLKHCKPGDDDGKKDNEEDKENEINFNNITQTFSRSTYCETCPSNKVKCNSTGRRGSQDPCRRINGKGKSWQSVFKGINGQGGNSNINVEMIDRRGPYMKDDLKKSMFKDSYIFKSVRDQKWICSYIDNEKDVCKLDNFDQEVDLNEYTTFKVFLEYWLEDFLYGYYILKKKIKQCTQKEGNGCSAESKNDCACVKEWLNKKGKEWEDIKKHFNNRNQEVGVTDMKSSVKTFLEDLQYLTELDKIIKPCPSLTAFEDTCGLNSDESSKKKKDGKINDVIDCMITKLQNKINECQQHQNNVENQNQTACDDSPLSGENSTPVEDEQLLEEEDPDQNTDPNHKGKQAPGFCEIKEQEEEEETNDKCEPDPVPHSPEPGGGGGEAPEEAVEDSTEDTEQREEEVHTVNTEETKKETPSPNKEESKSAALPPPQRPRSPKPGRRGRRTQRETKPPKLFEIPITEPLQKAMISNTLMWSVGIGFVAMSYWLIKKKTRRPVDMFSVLEIPQNDYGIPTLKSSNRYIPYSSGKYRGKRYIYLEGDSGTDSGYTDHYSDITSSSESEYEEFDINDIYAPGSPKYKTLIEVVLEPSKRDTSNKSSNTQDIQNITQSDTPRNKPINDVEWNSLKNDFISKILQNSQVDLPQNNISRDTSINTHPDISILHDRMQEKPFITSIHDRDLQNGEEVTYNINLDDHKNMNFSTNDDNIPPKTNQKDLYTDIDLINDSIRGNHNVDIYDEILKRKENELFGTNHVKQTSTHSVAKNTNSDPIMNQLDLFHKWLDRHRDICEKWENHDERLAKLKEKWENETHSGNKHSDIPSGKLSDTPSDNNIHSNVSYELNTDVSIQIDMDNPKTTNEFTYVDSNPQQIYYGYYTG